MNVDEVLIKELSVAELKKIISSTIEESMPEYYEDLIALTSRSFVDSVKESREDYLKVDFTKLQDL